MIGGEGDLSATFRRLIQATGPISLMHYMAESNARYYTGKDPLGGAGDFITAPEISQMFGELIGLWLADMWIGAGRDDFVHYVELGPGRGTLARDALRAMKRYGLEPHVHLVETSPALKKIQLDLLPDAIHHHDLSTVPMEGAVLLVANEFLDALPVRQLVKTPQGWRERMVVSEGEGFACIAGDRPMDSALPEARRAAPDGAIIETCPAAASTVFEVAGRLTGQGGAALFIDYGYDAPQLGSTFHAVRAHEKVDPFMAPGTADLTALVDFAAMADMARAREAKVLGVQDQGAWLRGLGIESRADALSEFAPQCREEIHAAMHRLIHPDQMGSLFKVLGLAHPDWPAGAGFA